MKGRSGDVVKSENGYVLRYPEALFHERADRTDCGYIVVGEDCSEWLLTSEQLLGERITQHRCWVVRIDLHGQLGVNIDADLSGHLTNGVPTFSRVGTYRIALHKRVVFMVQILEVV